MRAIAIQKPGGPEVLAVVERPLPEPSRGEVRVRVRATAVNRADLLQRAGAYPAPPGSPPDVPGLEIAGLVDAVGPDVHRLAVGDRVFGLVGGGGYAEAVVSHERALARIPERLSFEQAAAIPEAFITAHDAIVGQAGLAGGECLLVHAVGSGVGTAAVQLGRALGLDAGVVPEAGKFADAVRKIADPAVVLELVGGAYLGEDLRCLRPLGRIVLVGLMAGARHELDLGLVLGKRARILGTVLRSRPLEEKLSTARVFEEQVVPLFARGKLEPVIDVVLPLDDAARAHERMASNEGFGKIVLRV